MNGTVSEDIYISCDLPIILKHTFEPYHDPSEDDTPILMKTEYHVDENQWACELLVLFPTDQECPVVEHWTH